MDILQTIDAATGDLCACGCGQPLDADGPSAWWATEDCQRRWQGHGAPVRYRSRSVVVASFLDREEVRERVTAYILASIENLQCGLEGAAVALYEFGESMARYWPSEPEPEPPMLRAIAAKRHRNTGPRPAARAPRRIDATRGR